ncbi:hypothetical protein HYT25_03155 [Candidatus Pacearchaeota archaeon]|nr:hypothetical protein [Candidatus Pacearchaeota archaeon]
MKKNLIASLFIAGALTFSANALAQETEEKWKMPVPRGNLIATGNCDERKDSPRYFVYDAYSSESRDVWISLDRVSFFARYSFKSFDRIHVDTNGDGKAEYSMSSEGLELFCKNLKLN